MNEETALHLTAPTHNHSATHPAECPPDFPPTEPSTPVPPSPHQPSPADHQWFAMRCTYSRELRAKQYLEEDGIECFVPMKKVKQLLTNGEVEEKFVPAIHNLIFVHTTRRKMDAWKRIHEDGTPLRYIMDSATRHPVVVRDKEMHDFIRVTTEAADSILYLDHPETALRAGQQVEIIVGPFSGVRGHIVRIRRDRRVVVAVSGLMAAAMAHMPPSHFKIVQDEHLHS